MKYLKTFEAYDLRGFESINVCIAMFVPKEGVKIINIAICEMYVRSQYPGGKDTLEFWIRNPLETSTLGKPFFGTIKNGEIEFSGVTESLLDSENYIFKNKRIGIEAIGEEYRDKVQSAIVGFDQDSHKQIAELIGNQFKIRSGSDSKIPGIWGKDIKPGLFKEWKAGEILEYSWDLDFPETEEKFDKAFDFVNKFAVPTFVKN
jgi:hypothetical protein